MNQNARANVREFPLSDLAHCVREHHAMFCAYIQAAACDARPGDATTTAMLEVAAGHRRRIGELIVASRKRLAARDDWTRWVRESCWMHEQLAEYFVPFAPDASPSLARPEDPLRGLALKPDGAVTEGPSSAPIPAQPPSLVA